MKDLSELQIVAEIILKYMQEVKGCITQVSEELGINRKKLRKENLLMLRGDMIFRILSLLSCKLSKEKFDNMIQEIRKAIINYVELY